MLILHLPKLRFASQLVLELPVIPTTKQNTLNTDKKLDFSRGRVFTQGDKSENMQLLIITSNSSHYICPRVGYDVFYAMNCTILISKYVDFFFCLQAIELK